MRYVQDESTGFRTGRLICYKRHTEEPASMSAALEGIRVLDMTIWQQGIAASAMPADLGADIIKIEQP